MFSIDQSGQAHHPEAIGIGGGGELATPVHLDSYLGTRLGLAPNPGLLVAGQLIRIDQVSSHHPIHHRLFRRMGVNGVVALRGDCRRHHQR